MVGKMGIMIQPDKRVMIDTFILESGTKIIAAWVDENDIQDTSFAAVLGRIPV